MSVPIGARVTLVDPPGSRPTAAGVVVEPTEQDVVYAREVYTPHSLGPDHGQVLVCWRPDEPEKRRWHWPHQLRVDAHPPTAPTGTPPTTKRRPDVTGLRESMIDAT